MDGSRNNPGKRGHAALRRGRASVSGQVYLVTFVTRQRERLFSDPVAAHRAARAIADKRLWYRSRLLAWVLMPDHWHGLIELGHMESLSVCVQRLKTNVSKALREDGGGLRPIWASGFHDRALRSDENVLASARYVVANPLRAGLVESVGCYPYWDAAWI